jgi:hypothetical protein
MPATKPAPCLDEELSALLDEIGDEGLAAPRPWPAWITRAPEFDEAMIDVLERGPEAGEQAEFTRAILGVLLEKYPDDPLLIALEDRIEIMLDSLAP